MITPIHTLADLRADLPITRRCIYLQTGTYAPVPTSTQDYLTALLREENEVLLAGGSKTGDSDHVAEIEGARRRLATLLGVGADEVAWCYNTTSATRLAVQSFSWRPGDKIALTDVEHVSTVKLVEGMVQQLGVQVTVIPSGDGPTYTPDDFLEQLAQRLTPDHRLLLLCHVANTDGRRLPVAEAVRIARERGVKTLIDGAQAVGVFPVDVDAIDADFYSGSMHKWLMGPAGVGFLVVKRTQLPAYNPLWLPRAEGDGLTAGALSEVGTPNHVLRMGAAYSLATLQQIGLPQLEAQMQRLTSQLRTGLHAIKEIRNAGPDAWALSSSITTLQLANGDLTQCQQLVTLLRERYHIITKVRPEVCGVRISLAAFNTVEEVAQVLVALNEVVSR
ncbi:MAG: aminotransferase class V-fold PLP-dependent enzyme [Caldilineaceae bacterium]